MAENNNIIVQWADAHVFYNMYARKSVDNSSKIEADEIKWRQRVISKSPNGHLIINNSFFDTLKKSRKIYLVHNTYNLNEIEKNGIIFASGGCLVGSIYCSPLVLESNRLRMHNLGVYINDVEAPMILGGVKNKKPDLLIFEIDVNEHTHHNLIGIDYLRLGNIHYSIYKQLEYLLSYKERSELDKIVVSRIRRSLDYLTLCGELYFKGQKVNTDKFLEVFIENINFLPILGYLYFEVITEYILLFQDNNEARRYADAGEFYNPTYKELMYALQPKLKNNFKISSFQPNIDSVINYIEHNNIFTNFNSNHFKQYISERLIYWTNTKLLSENSHEVNWYKFQWDFINLSHHASPLLGHLIHRELRNFGRYPSFYFYFDQSKALQVWNYWNHMDISIPFNGVIPKGEIGINPALPDLNYKIYHGKYIDDADFKYIEPMKELDIKIEPKLVDLRYTNMHAKP